MRIGVSNPVIVKAGYDENLGFDIKTGFVSSVRVMTAPANTAVYGMSSCLKVRTYGSC